MDTDVLDIMRFVTMFLLGAGVSMEAATVRYTHVGILTPAGTLFHVPMVALALLALSRIVCLFFVAGVMHDHFGEPLSWQAPAALVIAVLSLSASVLVVRSKVK